jgi:hypothetical protein
LNQYQVVETALRINPLTLVEQTLEYFRLLHLVAEYAPEATWSTAIKATRMEEHGVFLRPGPLPKGIPVSGFYTENIAQADDWSGSIRNEGDPERDAYNALAIVYALFGLEENAIPYVHDERIDVDAIRAAG